jgi:hypothetical protein
MLLSKQGEAALYRTAIIVGIVLLVLGLQMRTVESYVLTPETTRFLARWVGPDPGTASGAVQQVVAANLPVRKTITPARWLGWAFISVGIVLAAYGYFGPRKV